MDENNFWINLNQINLINSIIDFFHKTGNDYMNYNEKGQIMNLVNLLNPDLSKLKQSNEIKYSLDYIKGEKKHIKFINSDFVLFNVNIPISFSKQDLYQIAFFYQFFNNSKILLVYNNDILKQDDESSIESFSDNDIIIIVENRIFPDDSYYNSLIKNIKDDDIINVRFHDLGKCKNLVFPKIYNCWANVKSFLLKYGYRKNQIFFENLLLLDKINNKISDIYPSIKYFITGDVIGYSLYIFGKKIKAKISFKNMDRILSFEIGTLNSINDLINRVNIDLREYEVINKIYLDEKEISIRNESLSSIGVTEDFNCLIEIKIINNE